MSDAIDNNDHSLVTFCDDFNAFTDRCVFYFSAVVGVTNLEDGLSPDVYAGLYEHSMLMAQEMNSLKQRLRMIQAADRAK